MSLWVKSSSKKKDGFGSLILVYQEVLDLLESPQNSRLSKLKLPKPLRGKKLVAQILKNIDKLLINESSNITYIVWANGWNF